MAAVITTRIMEDGPRNTILLIEGNNGSTGNPGTGGADLGVTSLITPAQVGFVNQATGQRPTAFRVDCIEWDVQAEVEMQVALAWNATPDQVFYSCIGRANKYFKNFGGLYAPVGLTGYTGGIDISTSGAPITQAAWTIVLYLVKLLKPA